MSDGISWLLVKMFTFLYASYSNLLKFLPFSTTDSSYVFQTRFLTTGAIYHNNIIDILDISCLVGRKVRNIMDIIVYFSQISNAGGVDRNYYGFCDISVHIAKITYRYYMIDTAGCGQIS